MADNTTLNSMTGGDVVATDDIGGAKYQRIKLVPGADGVSEGDVSSTNPLPTRDLLADQVSHLVNSLRFLSTVQGIAGDLRVTLLSGTVTTVTTVTTLTGQTNIGGFGAQHTIMAQMNTNAAQLRQQIITT